MTRTVLKRGLGDAGAFSDDFTGIGGSRLYDVLKGALQSQTMTARQATIATGLIAKMVLVQDTVLRNLGVAVEVAGSAGSTVVEVRRADGAVVATATIANTATDPSTQLLTDLNIEFDAGETVEFNVLTAPTGGTGLTMTAGFSPVDIE